MNGAAALMVVVCNTVNVVPTGKHSKFESYLQQSYIKGGKMFKPIEEYNYAKNKGPNHPQYGCCWIHNDSQSIIIKKEELESYLQQGYIKGRKIFKK